MKKLALYIPEPLAGVDVAPWLRPKTKDTFFARQAQSTFFDTVTRVGPQDAQVIVLPHNFLMLDATMCAYIKQYADLGERLTIPVILFSLGDHSDALRFDSRVKVLRLSVYRSCMQLNDVVMPTLTEDLGAEHFVLRNICELPVVSFCGRAAFSSTRERLASWARRITYETLAIYQPQKRARIRGIFWRQWMMRACRNSTLVKTVFIVRSTFSGALRTIELSPKQAREDFIKSMQESDFVLAPKGDGNHSNRFLEALSMGRIPVVVDTDMVLPFEDNIDYSKVMVRVPMNKVHETPRYVSEFYRGLDEAEWQKRQELARKIFVEYLGVDAFFSHFFDTVETCVASPEQPPKD